MPRGSRQEAAEFYQSAAHGHLAVTQHGKQDYQTGHEHSRHALEHSANAFSELQKAHRESATSVERTNDSAGVTDAE
jgi:hypothetical protein